MSSSWDGAIKLSDEVKSSNSKFLSLARGNDKDFTIGVLGSGPRSRLEGSVEYTRKWWEGEGKKGKMHDDGPGMDKKGFGLVAEFRMNWLELAYGNFDAKTFVTLPEPRRRVLTLTQDAFVKICEATEEVESDDGIWLHKFVKEGNKKTFPFNRYEGKKLNLTDELKEELAKFHMNKSEKYPWYNLSATAAHTEGDEDGDEKPPTIDAAQRDTLVAAMKANGGEEVIDAVKKEFGVEKFSLLPKSRFDEALQFIKALNKKKNGAADEFSSSAPSWD